MILVADSGSTKCDWLLQQPGSSPLSFHTMGFNPMFHTSEFIVAEIQKNKSLLQYAKQVTHVYYYGASVSSPDRITLVKNALKTIFEHAEISAEHDLTGAARATCGTEPGIACILGTGSNSCYFDGKEIHDSIPALGYVLGDEAGGAWFGREFLKLYLYNQLPNEINEAIKNNGHIKEEIFRRVYKTEGANVYLASLMPLILQFKNHEKIQEMLKSGFLEFLKYHVVPIKEHLQCNTHFVGSIGLHFREELIAVCNSMNIKTGIFTNKPIDNLFHYHITNHAQL
jgi:N-acetylglucosamine kinase-like BadF-type ATPase